MSGQCWNNAEISMLTQHWDVNVKQWGEDVDISTLKQHQVFYVVPRWDNAEMPAGILMD